MELKYDIVIIGANIAGCISAMYLYQDFKILVINKETQTNQTTFETLVASSKRIFKELQIHDVLNNFPKMNGNQSYWGGEDAIFTDSIKNPEGANILIEKNELMKRLNQKLFDRKISKITDTILKIYRDDTNWKIKLSKQTIEAGFIIDASGRSNVLKNHLQITKENIDKLIGLHAIIPIKLNLNYSLIYPEASGWFYFLPLNNFKTYVSYFTDSDLWHKKDLVSSKLLFHKLEKLNNEKDFFETLSFDNINFLTNKASHTSVLEKVVDTHWVAVGDAAFTVDPLSSVGMYHALIMSKFVSHALIDVKQGNSTTSEFVEHVYQFYKRFWDHYTNDYGLFYSSETRWQHAEFWKRRNFITYDIA